jgi:hypothetical protein
MRHRVERRGGRLDRLERQVAGLWGESTQPTDGGAVTPMAVSAPRDEADLKRIASALGQTQAQKALTFP